MDDLRKRIAYPVIIAISDSYYKNCDPEFNAIDLIVKSQVNENEYRVVVLGCDDMLSNIHAAR